MQCVHNTLSYVDSSLQGGYDAAAGKQSKAFREA